MVTKVPRKWLLRSVVSKGTGNSMATKVPYQEPPRVQESHASFSSHAFMHVSDTGRPGPGTVPHICTYAVV